MDLVSAFKTCIKKYADFSGRARRSEYWFFNLAVFLVYVALSFINALIQGIAEFVIGDFASPVFIVTTLIVLGALIALIPPGLAVTARRLHDTGRSAANFAWILLPLVGSIILLVYMLEDSKPGANIYGDPVK
jgi:uncharacterized membrane protein YhaH (DUF805 family)